MKKMEILKVRSKASKNDSSGDDNDIETDYVNSFYGKNEKKRDRLIVMDGISGLADRSDKFAGSLTTAQKFRYYCVYIFHAIFLKKAIWRSIISQTNLFIIFPAFVSLNSIKQMLQTNCKAKSIKKYISEYDLGNKCK